MKTKIVIASVIVGWIASGLIAIPIFGSTGKRMTGDKALALVAFGPFALTAVAIAKTEIFLESICVMNCESGK